jgi:hypothetical protein
MPFGSDFTSIAVRWDRMILLYKYAFGFNIFKRGKVGFEFRPSAKDVVQSGKARSRES